MLLLTTVAYGGQESSRAFDQLPEQEGELLRHRAQELMQIPREKRLPLVVQEMKRLVTARRGEVWTAEPERIAHVLRKERAAVVELVLRALPSTLADAVREHLPPTGVKLAREVKPEVLNLIRWKLEESLARESAGKVLFKFSDVLLLQSRELYTVADRLGARSLASAIAGLPEAERGVFFEALPPDQRQLAEKAAQAAHARALAPEDAKSLLALHDGGKGPTEIIRSAGAQRLARGLIAQSPEFAARVLERHRGDFGQMLGRWMREERARPAKGDGGRMDIVAELDRLAGQGVIDKPVRLPPPKRLAPPSQAGPRPSMPGGRVLPPPPPRVGERRPAEEADGRGDARSRELSRAAERVSEPGVERGSERVGTRGGERISEPGVSRVGERGGTRGGERISEPGVSRVGERGGTRGGERISEPGVSRVGERVGTRGAERISDPGVSRGSEPGAERGSERGAERGSERGAERGSERGAERGSERGAERGSERGAERGSERGAERGSERGAERGAERGSERGSERVADRGKARGDDRGVERGAERRSAERVGARDRREAPPSRGNDERRLDPPRRGEPVPGEIRRVELPEPPPRSRSNELRRPDHDPRRAPDDSSQVRRSRENGAAGRRPEGSAPSRGDDVSRVRRDELSQSARRPPDDRRGDPGLRDDSPPQRRSQLEVPQRSESADRGGGARPPPSDSDRRRDPIAERAARQAGISTNQAGMPADPIAQRAARAAGALPPPRLKPVRRPSVEVPVPDSGKPTGSPRVIGSSNRRGLPEPERGRDPKKRGDPNR